MPNKSCRQRRRYLVAVDREVLARVQRLPGYAV
jgi:hypothetical protein